MSDPTQHPDMPCETCADLRARALHALRLALALRERLAVAITPKLRRDFATWCRGYRALAFADRVHQAVHRGSHRRALPDDLRSTR